MRTTSDLSVVLETLDQPEEFPQAAVKLIELFLTGCRAILSGDWPQGTQDNKTRDKLGDRKHTIVE